MRLIITGGSIIEIQKKYRYHNKTISPRRWYEIILPWEPFQGLVTLFYGSYISEYNIVDKKQNKNEGLYNKLLSKELFIGKKILQKQLLREFVFLRLFLKNYCFWTWYSQMIAPQKKSIYRCYYFRSVS